MTRSGVSFIDKQPPAGFALRTVIIPPFGARFYNRTEWRDALVVVEQGAIELVVCSDRRVRVAAGAILALDRLNLRRINNRDATAAVLSVVSRPGN